MAQQPNKKRKPNPPKVIKKPKAAREFTLSPAAARVGILGSFVLILVGAVLWVVAWLSNPSHLPIERIEWQGDFQYLKKTDLDAIAQPYAQTNLYLLDATQLEQALEANEWVRDVSLRKVWPNELVVKVETQFPVAFWGEGQLLNKYGEIFTGTVPEKQGIFPFIYSSVTGGREMGERYVTLMAIFKGLKLEITELTEDQHGSWALRFREGPAVMVGRKEQEKRMQRLRVAYEHELRKTFDKIERIDLRYTNGLAVEWKQGFGESAANTLKAQSAKVTGAKYVEKG